MLGYQPSPESLKTPCCTARKSQVAHPACPFLGHPSSLSAPCSELVADSHPSDAAHLA